MIFLTVNFDTTPSDKHDVFPFIFDFPFVPILSTYGTSFHSFLSVGQMAARVVIIPGPKRF